MNVTITKVQGIVDQEELSFLVTAKIALDTRPEKDDADRIVIPHAQRESCEFAIEAICNVVSTFHGCSRGILSPTPCVALEWDDTEERQYLEKSRGILAVHNRDSGVRTVIPLQADLLTSVSDRLDGVALLAEAYSEGESGLYREFVRFFELAFRTPFTKLSKTLHKFLRNTPYGYTRAEIDRWVELRNPVSHADLKKTLAIALTSNVRRHILRMEQAALDVLFNKATWGDKLLTRRVVWRPDACTISEKGNVVIKRGSKPTLLFRTYDDFDVYPRILEAKLSNLKATWYFRMNEDNRPSI